MLSMYTEFPAPSIAILGIMTALLEKPLMKKTRLFGTQLPLVIIVVVLPLLVSYTYTQGDRYSSRRQLVTSKQEQDAQAVAAFVRSWLDDAVVLGASVAAKTRIGEFGAADLGSYLKSTSDLIPKFESIFATDVDGRLYGQARSLATSGSLDQVLSVARYAMSSGTAEIVALYPKGRDESTVVVIYPVHDARSVIVGAIAFVVRMDILLEDIETLHEGELGDYIITDELSRVVLTTNRRIPAGTIYPINSSATKRRVLMGSSAIATIGWTATSVVPVAKAMAPIYKGAARSFAVVLASLLSALLLARWFSMKYVKPLRELEEKVSERLEQAQEDERKRLARDIHDWINEHLVGMFYYLQVSGSDEAVSALDELCERLKAANVELRRIMNDLHPHLLEEEGLSAACKAHASEFQLRTGVSCRLEIAIDESSLSNRHKLTLFRILQEALANVRNHAKATAVYVSITDDGDDLRMVVSDNGVGFDAIKTKPGCLGLVGMRERAGALDGKLVVVSHLGQGTTVESQIPRRGGRRDR